MSVRRKYSRQQGDISPPRVEGTAMQDQIGGCRDLIEHNIVDRRVRSLLIPIVLNYKVIFVVSCAR